MNTQLHSIYSRLRSKVFGFFVLCMVMGVAIGLTPNASFAQQSGNQPPANTTIGNQASATYEDANGNERTVTSNTVETTVQQVAAVAISEGITKSVSPGGQVSFPHTITNNGNGTDSFQLSVSEVNNGQFNFDNIAVYADANGDGVPDNINSPIASPGSPGNTPDIAAGDNYSVVIIGDVPAGASAGNTEDLTITATSNEDGDESASATNTAEVSDDAVINVIKSVDPSTGAPGQTVEVTFTFTNDGNQDGTNLAVTDELPTGFTYVGDSGEWSGSGTDLTDASDGDEGGITYFSSNGTVNFTVAELAAGQQGTVTFNVTVDNDTDGQTITNTADFNYDGIENDRTTNTASFKVEQEYSVDIVGDQTVEEDATGQGGQVDFLNQYVNDGSVSDRYNISLDNSNYPHGTTFTLYKVDDEGNATSPLTDSNGDGIQDVGPVAAGENFSVILRANLPSNAGDGTYTVDKTATSIGDPTQSATHTDQLNGVTQNEVDLTNNTEATSNDGSGTAPGEGVTSDGEADPVTTNETDPGTTTEFSLFINNNSGQEDNYNLAASSSSDFSAGLPDGWTVDFRNADGNSITNVSVEANSAEEVTAVVAIPQGAEPSPDPGTSIYFEVESPSTGARDVKHDAVIIATNRALSLVSNQSGQIAPGGSKLYTHTLTNAGNVTEDDDANSSLQLSYSNSQSGFTSVVYIDENGDGQIDDGDTQISSGDQLETGALAPGDQVKLLVKVTAGSGVSDNTTNTTTITVEDDGTDDGVNGQELEPVSVQDITTVVAGNLEIVKRQRLQGSGNDYVKSNIDANPGEVIEYQITVTNQGSGAVSTIDLTDSTPAYTTIATEVAAPNATSATGPGAGESGTINVTKDSLAPGESFVITFAVQIDGSN